MEQKLGRVPVMAATGLLAIAGLILRSLQLRTAFDEAGMVTGKGVWPFSVVTFVILILLAVYSRKLQDQSKYGGIHSSGIPVLVGSTAAALLLTVSSLLRLAKPMLSGDRLVALLGFLTVLCWAAVALLRSKGQKPSGLLFFVPAVFCVIKLICQFRFWSRDPVILDYCYDLGAMIFAMLSLFHLGQFAFEKGRRRLTVFYTMSGIFFCASAVANGTAADRLFYLAAVLWLGTHLWLLLRPVRQSEMPQRQKKPKIG